MTNEPIRFVLPVALADVFEALAPTFRVETGYRFETVMMLNPEVPAHIATGAAWSVAASNPCYIEKVVAAGGCDPRVRFLGHAPLALAAIGDVDVAPVSSTDGIANALLAARTIAITGSGTSGKQFRRLIGMLGLEDAVRAKVRPLPGGGPITALRAGQVDLAALPLTNVAPVECVRVAAICPWQFDAHVDLSICISERANAGARRFADWLVDPALDGRLRQLGLFRHRSPT